MSKKNWRREDLSVFCLELSMLLRSGISVEESFSALAENEEDSYKRQVFNALYEGASMSSSVYEVMSEAGVFPQYMLSLILIGEKTGRLEEIFASLSRYFDERIRTSRLIKDTVMFPVVLLITMLAVIILLLTEVLPIFQNVFEQLGSALPLTAVLFLNIGTWLRAYRFVFLTVAVIIVIICICGLFIPRVRERFKAVFNRLHGNTRLGVLTAQAHFASALYMTMSGGLNTEQALSMTADFCKNTSIEKNIRTCREKASEGMALDEAVRSEGLLKPMYCHMLSVGIRSGNVDAALREIAERTEKEAYAAVTDRASRVEPVVVIALSVLVGLMLLSVMFPLVGIMSTL